MAYPFQIDNWYHDFPKLARDSGFQFNMHRSGVQVDWNGICSIDIDRVIEERDCLTVEQNVNNIIDYSLENEDNVDILDPNFIKLFRLAQLAVEYLQYCKQYLDQSVMIMQGELKSKIEENLKFKKEVTTLLGQVKSLEEKLKYKDKMLETKISDSSSKIYKCPSCTKIFISATFVQAHIFRRHPLSSQAFPISPPPHEKHRTETEKLKNEIETLKKRLNQPERVLKIESNAVSRNVTMSDDMKINGYDGVASRTNNQNRKMTKNHERYQDEMMSSKAMLFNELQVTFDSENMQSRFCKQEECWRRKIKQLESRHRADKIHAFMQLELTRELANQMKVQCESNANDLGKSLIIKSKLEETWSQINSDSESSSILKCFINNSSGEIPKDSKFIEIGSNGFSKRESLENMKKKILVFEDVDNLSIQESKEVFEDDPHRSGNSYSKTFEKNNHETKKHKKIEAFESRFDTAKNSDPVLKMALNKINLNRKSLYKECSKGTTNFSNLRDEKCRHMSINENHFGKSHTHKEKASMDICGNEKTTGANSRQENHKKKKKLEMHSFQNESVDDELNSGMNTEVETSASESEQSLFFESINENPKYIEGNAFPVFKMFDEESMNENLFILDKLKSILQKNFDNKLQMLGIDPEWNGIPKATFKEKFEILTYQKKTKSKKLIAYDEIQKKLLADVFEKMSIRQKLPHKYKHIKKNVLNKMIGVKSNAAKALNIKKMHGKFVFQRI